MMRGCVLALLLLASLVCGYFYWLNQIFEWPGNLIGASIAGLVVFFCFGALQTAWTSWRDAARLGDIDRQEPLEDGKVVAVSGTIHPIGESLRAPFSGEECVVCEQVADPDCKKRTRGNARRCGCVGCQTWGADCSGAARSSGMIFIEWIAIDYA